ncbi:MAG TPA: phosphatidylserine/phosphatidylglycerophosphate/cardiolipin synthase family protein, partial [Saprospiraceae bacterium]|nr:phosphatidylserine/phosphatidylglycerophosphate/cardiolipin synthase family protein [Saprospiraceae bacterium]
KQEILFSTYIIKGDAIGHGKLKTLADAAKRGVKVKVILDDRGNKMPTDMLLYLKEQGVEVKIFNKQNWLKPQTVFRRMHGKMLIVDSTYLLVGGRNVDNAYFRMDSVSNFLDREVLVRGSRAVGNARQHFLAMWNHEKLCHPVEGSLSPVQRQQCAQLMDSSIVLLRQQLPKLRVLRAPDTLSAAATLKPTVSPVNFIHANFTTTVKGEKRRARNSDRRVTQEMLELVASADYTLDIEAAYFLPTHRWMKALRAAHKRGVRIRVMTNSAASNDLTVAQAVYSNKRNRYRRAGIGLYEYCGGRMVHVKAMVIDTQISVIGSYNMERKSERLNTEVMAWVNDPHHARLHLALFERNLQKCKPYKGTCATPVPPLTPEQRKRKRTVGWMRYTIAPLADLMF